MDRSCDFRHRWRPTSFRSTRPRGQRMGERSRTRRRIRSTRKFVERTEPHRLGALPLPREFRAKAQESDVIVAHAGMGSILTALELGKPIVVMPRRAHLGEHRNDHQWATANHLGHGLGIPVAADEAELIAHLDHLTELRSPTERRSAEYTGLLDFLRGAIDSPR